MEKFWKRLEIWIAIVVLAASFTSVGLTASAMATTSLETDEFGTIGTFSSRGPWRVLTDYRAPKNHIFFNLLNSVLPGRASLDPLRARALSLLATILTGALIAAWAARRGQWIEGAAIVALWSLAPDALSLSMEARGYGFLGLFAVVLTIATLEYLRTGRRRWLVALVLATALGAYTVPSFAFFAGPVLLLLWLAKRDRKTFLAGATAGGLTLLLYAPVLTQLAAAFGQYQTSDEAEFGHLSSLWLAARLFLLPGSDVETAAFLAALLFAPLAFFRWRPRGLGLIAVASAIYFAILLILRTPPLRVAAFGFLPAMMAGFLAAGAAARHFLPPAPRSVLWLALGAFLTADLVRGVCAFDFVPAENWTLAGRAIDAAFPPAMRVDYRRLAKYLDHTLPGARERSAEFDAAAFADGRLVVVDGPNKWTETARFNAPADVPQVVQWTIPGRIRDLTLTFRRPPADAGIAPALSDGSAGTGIPLAKAGATLRLSPPPSARAVVILLDQPVSARRLTARANRPGIFLAGNAVVLPLERAAAGPVEISLFPRTGGLSMTEAWVAR